MEEGRKEGREEGMKEGRKGGREEGREKEGMREGGRKEQNRTLYLYTEFLQLQRIAFRESRVKNYYIDN